MMRAVCGFAGDGDPVLRAAHELAVLHERREQLVPGDTSEIDWERARLVCEIDRWVVIRSPRPGGGGGGGPAARAARPPGGGAPG
ncbi:hypothetical protein ACFWPJ_23925, partial [Nocardia sp. NPDC058497]